MIKPKTLAIAAFAALFSLSLAGTALAQATPATPPANAQKGQAKKEEKKEEKAAKEKAAKEKAAKEKAAKAKKSQGQKKGMDDGKKTGLEKKKAS